MQRAVVVSLLVGVALAGCSAPESEPLPPATVLVQTVAPEAVQAGRYFTGEIVPRHATDLGFRVGGKLIARAVDVGSVVKKGQVLARLDAEDTRLGASAAQAQLAAAQSELSLAQAELARVKALRAQNFVSDSAVDTRRTTQAAAAARVKQASAQAVLAANQNEYTTLVADVDGVVTAVRGELGQVLAAGQPVLTLAQDGAREVKIAVPEGHVAQMPVGTPARVALWADQKTALPAVVREVSPAADPQTRTYMVKVEVKAEAANLPLGATATVALAGDAAPGVVLPLRAVGEREGQPVVWVFDVATESVSPVPVTVTRFDERGAHVAAGVAPGAQVVVAGVHLLRPGQTVKSKAVTDAVTLDAKR
ncbi:efflux RND transporter periplasmic adaptor subunit [Denitromonas ohlonensis]|uniref:Efflux RND transporter periplasmic adaptor subunit n=2 Tax=Denitromonas TaxID=139331 RepID=A0A557R558_9RHOO|nr:efflux RND transporter periplasmic adaptor subunit [Denitromonas ohlonensis]TVO60291.1 efflux RND transporter periplasmic adaptor subunit [Denitromonas ohlonensis]TVO75730.1 efflux RND transporter periplasmic adaptor subunit [Denitromonas ohlonensis]